MCEPLGNHAITIEEFKIIYEIFKKYIKKGSDYELEKFNKVKEKIIYLNSELRYVILEWTLLKEIDNKIEECSSLRENKTIWLLKESLWYAIIMKIAKIMEKEDKSKVNINKVFNFCRSNSIVNKKNIISEEQIKEMENKIQQISKETNEIGEEIDLIKCWRDEYLSHNDKMKDLLEFQKNYLITNRKMEKIINSISDILNVLCEKFEINFNEVNLNNEIEEITKQVDFIYNKCIEK